MSAVDKLLNTARKEIGYCETGDNCTKYAINYDYDTRVYGWDMNGSPWCSYFVLWCFCEAFGLATGTAMLYQFAGCSGAACRYAANYFRNHGAYYQYPEVGDNVFFYYSGDINHVGIVEEVHDDFIITIEGNSSDAVRRNRYSRGNSIIAGYGRPNWSLAGESILVKTEEEKEEAIHTEVKAGDIVKVSKDAEWYNGASILPFVFEDKWEVLSLFGSRAVLNWNESHTNSIMSPIDVKYLTVVKECEAEDVQPDIPTDADDECDTGIKRYTVKKGDTLWGIAAKTMGSGLRYKELMEYNHLTSIIIHPNEILNIP